VSDCLGSGARDLAHSAKAVSLLCMGHLLADLLVSHLPCQSLSKVCSDMVTWLYFYHSLIKLNNTCIQFIFLYGCECWAVTKRDAHNIDALDYR